MMNDAVALIVAVSFAIISWAGALAFVIAFAREPWRKTPIGRTQMYRAASMVFIFSYVLATQIFRPPHIVELWLSIGVWFILALVEWRLFLVLRYVQKGKINKDNLNYTPFTDRARKILKKERRNG